MKHDNLIQTAQSPYHTVIIYPTNLQETGMMNDPALDSFAARAQHALKHEAEVKQLVNKSVILVGRDKELEILQNAFAADSPEENDDFPANKRKPRVMCIWGEAGCGKSTLVKAARASVESKDSCIIFGSTSDSGPYICYGKYTLDGRGESGLARCIKDLVRQIVDRDLDMGIRRRLQETFSESDADVLIETFPAISMLLDSKDEDSTEEGTISEMDKTRRGKRRQFLLLKLFQQLTIHTANQYRDEDIPDDRSVEGEHLATRPIIMVLDDVQWACQASMDMITALVRNQRLEHFLLIATSRPTVTSEANVGKAGKSRTRDHHCFQDAMRQWKKLDIVVEEICLQNFDDEHVNELVAKILDTDPDAIALLGSTIFQKTKGHPLYTTEFLKTLVNQKMVKYNFGQLEWTYDIALIEETWNASISTNTRKAVIELFQGKLQSLPSQQHRIILQVAACLGASFTESFFDQIFHCISSSSTGDKPLLDSSKNLDTILKDCVSVGLLSCFSTSEGATKRVSFMFVHDLAREATLMKDATAQSEDLKWLKMKVGKRLIHLADVDRKNQEQQSLLFLGVDLCNEACSSRFPIMEGRDCPETSFLVSLAGHNLLAGQKSVRESAYHKAVQYMEAGLTHLETAGDGDSQMSLYLLSGLAEAAYCLGDYEKMQAYSNQVMKRANCPTATRNKMAVFQILSTTVQREHKRGLMQGRMALETLGMPKVPAEPTLFHVLVEFMKTRRLLRNHSREMLLALPLLTDKNRLSAMRIVDICMVPAYLSNQNFFLVTFLRALRWSVKYGICQYSPSLFATYGLIQMTTFGDNDALSTYSDVALKLAERIGSKEGISKTSYICFSYCRHWMADMRSCIPPLLYAKRLAMEAGDTDIALQCMFHHHFLAWSTSKLPLPKLADELYQTVTKAHEVKNPTLLHAMLYMARSLRRLCAPAGGDCFAWLENETIGSMQSEFGTDHNDPGVQLFYDSVDLQSAFLLGDRDKAIQCAKRTEGIGTKVLPGCPYGPQTQFYRGLLFLSEAMRASNNSKKQDIRSAHAIVAMLRKWSEMGSVSCTHRLYLLEAEEARVTRNMRMAKDHYAAAIHSATRTLHEQDVAIAHECAARFYLEDIGDKVRATHHAEQAVRSYLIWGAGAKAKLLTKPYTDLLCRHASTATSILSVGASC